MSGKLAPDAGTLLLLLAQHSELTSDRLANFSECIPADITAFLKQLCDNGFAIEVDAESGPAYRLRLPDHETLSQHNRILLVDDTEAIRRLVSVLLEDDGYSVLATARQEVATALVRSCHFDLILTDAYSRDGDDALLHSANLIAAAGSTPVALFSGHRVDHESLLTAGFVDFIAKPFDIDELSQRIHLLLEHGHQRGESVARAPH